MVPAAALAALSVSVHFDWRLAPYDLMSSRAHARVLHRAGLLDDDELRLMVAALDDLDAACQSGAFVPTVADEDVHTALERGLIERLGPLGGKLRAGRSRNDQIATDLRLYLRAHVRLLVQRLADLETALVDVAERHKDAPAPGMTHLQHAQPVLFAHHLLAHVQAFARDVDRLRDWDVRAAISPLGAGALAGSSLPLDPVTTAHELGFTSSAANSIDAVSDRDFAAEFAFCAAMVGIHLSRIGEEIVLWTSREFRWVELDDSFATGSSIMPQKKNPDVAELARGQDWPPRRQSDGDSHHAEGPAARLRPGPARGQGAGVRLARHAARAAAGRHRHDRDHARRHRSTRRGRTRGFALATDVAEDLVRRGVPFREAHEAVGRLVAWCAQHNCDLPDVDDAQLAELSPHLTPGHSVGALCARRARRSVGPWWHRTRAGRRADWQTCAH